VINFHLGRSGRCCGPPQLDAADTSSATRLRLARWIPSVEHSTAPPIVPGTNGPVGRAPILTRSSSQGSFSREQWAARRISAVSSAASPGRLLWQHSLPPQRIPGWKWGSESRCGRRIRGVEPQGCFASPPDTPLVPGWQKGKLRVIYKQSRLPIYHKSLDWDAFFAEYPVSDVFERTRLLVAARETSRVPEPPMRRGQDAGPVRDQRDRCPTRTYAAQQREVFE
jgi:hypothetical protein